MAAQDLGTSEWERSKISGQDVNLMKKLGLTKKKDAVCFPSEESYPSPPIEYRVSFVDHLIRGLSSPIHDFLRGLLFVYGLQLHHLTPNSILHVSIFITLCECFLGVHSNWALWKRIFYLHRNGFHNIAYNIGGVVICVRPDVEYFDVKFPDSVQGWRKRWLYVREECADSLEHNIPPFNGSEKILRRRSWDAEATDEEKSATEALMKRIHELQNTRGKELSGIQITAYFLRIRVQPLQARKNPLWMYAGDKDVDRVSKDLPDKDMEKLVRKISSLSKKDAIPTSCRVVPYSGTNALPQPLMQPFINLGTQFIGYRNTVNGLKEALLAADKRADDLAVKLKESEEAREKAEKDASSIEDLRKRLHKAETALSDKITQQIAREENIISRLESLNRRFVRKMNQDFELQKPEDDRLLDALSLLEIHGDLVRRSIFDVQTAFSRLFPYFFPKTKQPDTSQTNPSKEIFSELDEINARGPIFPRSFQTEEITKWATRRRHHRARARGPAPPMVWALVSPRCPSAYLKPSSRIPLYREPRYGNLDAAAANPISGFGDRPALWRGNHHRRGSTSSCPPPD
ncbi:hypothetical protein QYE76_031376 [Lolium multiflorum]|uniref:Transposase (putative) gypsy type domain-containing protein n=1 Tax=Lolium multiflorum TaxID=4521 RepID=A0AAD8QRK0_LOLMU|nr:hypothetical protein QYE76_031376 [Lolium multiflorum]